jgi:hypothetical protein
MDALKVKLGAFHAPFNSVRTDALIHPAPYSSGADGRIIIREYHGRRIAGIGNANIDNRRPQYSLKIFRTMKRCGRPY